MTKSGRWKVITGLGVACAACCAPLLLPLLGVAGGAGVASAAASGLFGRTWAQLACDAVIVALAASALFLWLRGRAKRKQAASCACEPATANDASCAVGGSCDPTTGRKAVVPFSGDEGTFKMGN